MFPQKNGVKGGHGFEIAVRMDNVDAGTGARYKTSSAHRVRSMHSRSSLFSLFCSAGVLFNSNELGLDFFALAQ